MPETQKKELKQEDLHPAGFRLEDDGGTNKLYPAFPVFGGDAAEFESLAAQTVTGGGAANRLTVLNITTATLPAGQPVSPDHQSAPDKWIYAASTGCPR